MHQIEPYIAIHRGIGSHIPPIEMMSINSHIDAVNHSIPIRHIVTEESHTPHNKELKNRFRKITA
jgi:hypothetical protein